MKLKEKMAEGYSPNSVCLEDLHIGCLTRDAFLAGFDKARDMALELESIYLQEGDRLMEEMMSLGEEEVCG